MDLFLHIADVDNDPENSSVSNSFTNKYERYCIAGRHVFAYCTVCVC